MRTVSKLLAAVLVVLLLVGTVVVTAQEDNAQRNKQIFLDVVTAYNAGDREAFYSMLNEPFMMNQGDAVLYEMSADDVRGYDSALTAAMPDLQQNADVIVAQGDWVAVQVTFTGTFTEPFSFPPFGPDAFEPNNAVITWTEMNFLHFNSEGLVDTGWLLNDPTVQFGQMGLMPADDAGSVTGTQVDSPAGYQTLSADELAATFISGNADRNRQLFSDMMAGINKPAVETEFYASPYISWNRGVPYEVTAEDMMGDQAFLDMLNAAMPDLTQDVTVLVAEGDWLAALVVLRGTFTEDVDVFGTTLSHTGEQIAWTIGAVQRYNADGKIIDEWTDGNVMPLLQGLGLVPAF